MLRLIAILIILCLPTYSHASTDYVEVLSGYSIAPLNDPQPDYVTIPLRIAFTDDAEPMLRRIFGSVTDGTWEYQIEPFIDNVMEPHRNVEVGFALGLKYTFDTAGDVRPYIKVSTGPMYTSQPTLEQATKFNFGSQAALGLQIHLSEDSALLLEARLRHFSNAAIETPNSGVDSNYLLAGWRWKVR
ncbi:MAG: acyloxyacyl hydrolase [bacterium]|nr:acyloxyacyl hydrolase [bacterium]